MKSGGAVGGPRPTTARGNDWRRVEVPPLEGFVPALGVTVVVTHHEAPDALARTLAALDRQSYPRDLLEVIVVDDGSRVPLRRPSVTSLDLEVIHREGVPNPARARNTGARASRHGILVFLDCDMMPGTGWLTAHARWHHAVSDVLTLGFRIDADVDDLDQHSVRDHPGSLEDSLGDRAAGRPGHIEFQMARTNDLTSTADDIFRVVTSGNLGIGREFFETVGGFDESFTGQGAVSTEFGYRAFTRGALIVPERAAFCRRRARGAPTGEEESRNLDLDQARIAHLVAHQDFRSASSGRSFTVPRFVVTIATAESPADEVFGVIERILADRVHDLVVRIEDRPDDDGFELIRRHFSPDPRVRFGPLATALDEFPTAAFHVTIPPGADVPANLVYSMWIELGGAVAGTMTLSGGGRARITRTRLLHRSRRSGRSITELGARVSLDARRMVPDTRWRRRRQYRRNLARYVRSTVRRCYWRLRRARSMVVRVLRAVLRIRSPRQAWSFIAWLAGAVRSRLRAWTSSDARRATGSVATAVYPLGAEIVALGERAGAVLGASTRVGGSLGDGHVDLVVADDTAAVPPGEDRRLPTVYLAGAPRRLSVPAIDPLVTNPIGWVRDPDLGPAALGSPTLLPDGFGTPPVAHPADRDRLARTRHLVDVAAFHPDVISRARTLVALAATGVVIHLVDDDPHLEACLGSELHDLMSSSGIIGADLGDRELFSIGMRRAALRDHSLRSRARSLLEAGSITASALPEVSVLAVATRPGLLSALLGAVSLQTYPRLELVLVLHGDGFAGEVEAEAQQLPRPVQVLRAGASRTLGAILNRAAAMAGGSLITRMDEGSLYGAEHVWDLVLAHEYSAAEVVAKGPEFRYLAHLDRTIHLHAGRGEEFGGAGSILAEGAMLVSRHDLSAAGGWRRRRTGLGTALVSDVASIGGAVYRTHGAGYLRIVEGDPKAGSREDAYRLGEAAEVWEGCDPARAGLDPDPSHPPAGGTARKAGELLYKTEAGGPGPVQVKGNEWHRVAAPELEDFVPTLPVSVVVPYYEAPEALDLTLAALERQTYPRDLFEVVVVDDGSAVPLRRPTGTELDVRVVHQEDRGFGLARARNTGARAAAHGILLFLDCDMMPEAGWMAAHARWHHVLTDALTLGFRAHVEVDGVDAAAIRNRPGSLEDLFSDRPSDRPEWIEFHMIRTDDLTSTADDLFRVVTGGNLGMSRGFFETAGGFDESFTQWGAEDTEFGYRAFTRGALLVPVRDGFCWHQGVGAAPSEAERRSLELQRAKIAHLIAHYGFRGAPAGRSFTVPQFVVAVEAGFVPADDLFDTVERVLGDRVHDLVVVIEDRPGDEGFEWLRQQLDPDPRVRFGPADRVLDDFPTASFHVTIPPGADVPHHLVHTLRSRLGEAVFGTVTLADGARASIVRTWALHRAHRTGRPLVDWGAVVASEAGESKPGSPSVLRSRAYIRRFRRLASKAGRVLEELGRIRSADQAWRFARWFAGAVGWRVKGARRYRRSLAVTPTGADSATAMFGGGDGPNGTALLLGGRGAAYPLGADLVAVGPRSVGVFRASTRVGRSVAGRKAELLVADSPSLVADVVPDIDIPLVSLTDLPSRHSVPAFDDLTINPMGWRRTPDRGAAALGSPDLLPPRARPVRRVARNDRRALRAVHHIEDVAAFHSGPTSRAATLAALAGMGVVVHVVDHDPALESRLGAVLYGMMAAPDVLDADLDGRESISIAMRREALRDHSLRSRARHIIGAGLPDPPDLPEVSVLAPTKRPELVEGLLATVSRQTYPRIELVLVLHGDGFDRDVEGMAADLPFPVRVLRVSGRQSFGAVLNRAVSVSGGELLTKIDDDDLYSTEHVWDLVLAHDYSTAELVAKGAEFVYLARSDQTIHRFCGRGESASRVVSIAGGTLLISRHHLDAAGGWRRVPRGVDTALVEDVRRAGGVVYRTHGFGYVLVRHGSGHTWESDDGYFLQQAETVRRGWAPEFAGLEADAVPFMVGSPTARAGADP